MSSAIMSDEKRKEFLRTFDMLVFYAWEAKMDKQEYTNTLIQRIDDKWAEFEAAQKSYSKKIHE